MGSTVLASLQLAAALLDEQAAPDPRGQATVLDVEVGGYRWTACRSPRLLPEALHPDLSPRELEIARMVADGLTNRAIASVLDISPWTVGTHLRRIFSKLDVSSRAAMVALVVERGIRTPGPPPQV